MIPQGFGYGVQNLKQHPCKVKTMVKDKVNEYRRIVYCVLKYQLLLFNHIKNSQRHNRTESTHQEDDDTRP